MVRLLTNERTEAKMGMKVIIENNVDLATLLKAGEYIGRKDGFWYSRHNLQSSNLLSPQKGYLVHVKAFPSKVLEKPYTLKYLSNTFI